MPFDGDVPPYDPSDACQDPVPTREPDEDGIFVRGLGEDNTRTGTTNEEVEKEETGEGA